MVTQPVPQTKLHSPEEYLALEREAESRSEYLNGEIYALAGTSLNHSIIAANVTGKIWLHLQGKPCRTLTGDMKVRTDPTGLYAYPDLIVVCGEPAFHDDRRDVLLNPIVIVEALSPSTEAYDRGRKFAHYRRIDILADYLLISQDEPRIEHYARQPDNRWLLAFAEGLEASAHIASIDCPLALAEVYDKVF